MYTPGKPNTPPHPTPPTPHAAGGVGRAWGGVARGWGGYLFAWGVNIHICYNMYMCPNTKHNRNVTLMHRTDKQSCSPGSIHDFDTNETILIRFPAISM